MHHLKVKEAILEVLVEISNNQVDDRACGLCANVADRMCDKFNGEEDGGGIEEDIWYEVAKELFASWPEYSGNENYPVPAPDSFLNTSESSEEQSIYCTTDDIYIGEYGATRQRLVSHMIVELRYELEAANGSPTA